MVLDLTFRFVDIFYVHVYQGAEKIAEALKQNRSLAIIDLVRREGFTLAWMF